MQLQTRSGRGGGLVDVDSGHRRPGRAWLCSPDGVVKEQHPVCAGDVLQNQFLDFRVVNAFYMCIILPFCFLRGDVGESGEGVAVECALRFVAAEVGDGDVDGYGGVVCLWFPWGRRFDVVEGFGAVGGGRVEVEGCGDGAGGGAAGGGGGGGGCEGEEGLGLGFDLGGHGGERSRGSSSAEAIGCFRGGCGD